MIVRLLGGLCGALVVSAFGLFLAAAWTHGPTSSSFGASGAICLGGAFVSLMAACGVAMVEEDDYR